MKTTLAILALLVVGAIVAIIGYAGTPSAAAPPAPPKPVIQPAAQPVVSCNCGPKWEAIEERIAALEAKHKDLEIKHARLETNYAALEVQNKALEENDTRWREWAKSYNAQLQSNTQTSQPQQPVSTPLSPKPLSGTSSPPVVAFSATTAPVRLSQPAVVRLSGPSGWVNHDGDLATHLRRIHGVNVSGLSPSQLRTVHDNLHNTGRSGLMRQTAAPAGMMRRYAAPRIYSLGCPGGRCP